ncbi:MAG: 4-cresol dehydrogenase (hydroxylating) flavoprotein subunit [Acidimicrobiaceae bacterium]
MSLGHALREWSAIVGEQHVISGGEGIRAASTATYPTTQGVPAIVRPLNGTQVQECVKVAARHRVPLYPISGGKNWGYGSRVPPVRGSVVLDLGRMKRIVAYDEEMAYVTVEPGVTQQILHDHLEQHGGKLWMDGTGSSPDASILGNIVERGYGATVYGDHAGWAMGYEIVLPDGELLHTGYGAYPDAKMAALDRWSPGPQLDGLFSQSNLGIVTKVTIPLMPAPATTQLLMLDLADSERLASAVDVMRGLQLDGTVRSSPWFGNCYRLLAALGRFPWHRAEPPLSVALAEEIAAEHGLARFTGFAALYGSFANVTASRRQAVAAFRQADIPIQVIDDASLARAADGGRRSIQVSMYRWYTGGIVNGVRRAYWRKRTPASPVMDPDRDGVGFIFVNASIPFRGKDIAEATERAEEIVLAHGFEPAFSCHSVRPRAFIGLLAFAWDREVAGDDQRAFDAHDAVAREWASVGLYPVRLGLHSFNLIEDAEPTHRALLGTLKQAIDPHGVIAPGRYIPA